MRKLFYLCLAIILGFLGAVSPVILPKGLTASTQEVSIRKSKLSITPVEEENTIEVDRIKMTILKVDPFVLPLPKQEPDERTQIRLSADIDNNRRRSIRLHYAYFLIPQLVGLDGKKFLSPKIASNRLGKTQPLHCMLIKPDVSSVRVTKARLFWQNNKLHFAGSDDWGNRWDFADLEPGTYQMRLKYIDPYGKTTCLDKKNRERKTTKIDSLVTPFIKLHLAEPIQNRSNAIEINGVRFETVVSPQKLTIPDNQPDARKFIRLGLRISNNTSEEFIVNWCYGAWLEIIDSKGKRLQNEAMSFGLRQPTGSDFYLIFPEESTEFVVNGMLSWFNNSLTLSFKDKNRDLWWQFSDIKPDTYQIRFFYRNPSKEIESFDIKLLDFYERMQSIGLWKGEVVTPLVKVDLMSTDN